MSTRYQITAVSFLNTLPFLYGLEQSKALRNRIRISKDIPSMCAKKMIHREADIGLIPIAALPQLKDYSIISDFCIGSKQQVDSVFLFAEQPINSLKTILLDYRSMTSINLVKILSKYHWKITPDFIHAKQGYESSIQGNNGGVVIGDKALELIGNFPYQYDLATEWNNFTGEEFVFAVWVSLIELDTIFLNDFNQALNYGITHISETIKWSNTDYSHLPAESYLTNKIDYYRNDSKNKSLKIYLDALKKIENTPN
jgi:chorismate dehydratase